MMLCQCLTAQRRPQALHACINVHIGGKLQVIYKRDAVKQKVFRRSHCMISIGAPGRIQCEVLNYKL